MAAVPQEVKRARRTALVLAASCIITLLSILYGYLQRLEVEKQKNLAVQLKSQLDNCEQQTVKESIE